MGRDRRETAAAAVVIPVHAEEISRIGPIGIDGAERRDARLRHDPRIGEFGEARQSYFRPAQPLGRPVANGDVDNSRHNRVVHHGFALTRQTPSYDPGVATLTHPRAGG
jgi:hypothetical protein